MDMEARNLNTEKSENDVWHAIKLLMEMAVAEKSTAAEQPALAQAEHVVKKKVLSCFKGVRLLQTLIILGCSIIVLQQIVACVNKLIDIPVTTYTHFDFNKTIVYPSVTFCREPAYKYDKMLDYGLYSHPRFTSVWVNYNFSISLDDLWEDITYTERDIFVQFGLDGSMDSKHGYLKSKCKAAVDQLPQIQMLLNLGTDSLPNVEVHPSTGFVLGRCYTLIPRTLATHPSKNSGYSVTLRHSPADMATAVGVEPPGYHVFVHYTREPFTEVEVYNGGLVQRFFMNVGETIEVKLTIDEYVKISGEQDPCSDEDNYSANVCTEEYVWDVVGQNVGCSGPWMTSGLPRCDNYNDMRNLITNYRTTYKHHDCNSCPRFCRSYLYSCFVTDRQAMYTWDSGVSQWILRTADSVFQTQVYIYFNSMMVSVYEERYNYDWNLFISDLGGSIGFLLGLSVIGMMKIMGKAWHQFICPFVKSSSRKSSITASTSTVDIATIKTEYPEIVRSEDQWKKISD